MLLCILNLAQNFLLRNAIQTYVIRVKYFFFYGWYQIIILSYRAYYIIALYYIASFKRRVPVIFRRNFHRTLSHYSNLTTHVKDSRICYWRNPSASPSLSSVCTIITYPLHKLIYFYCNIVEMCESRTFHVESNRIELIEFHSNRIKANHIRFDYIIVRTSLRYRH